MAEAACITEVVSASAMAEDMAAMWCARYELVVYMSRPTVKNTRG